MKRRILALILIMICLGHFPVCSHAIDNKFVATSFTPSAIDTSDPSKIGMILNGVNVPFDVNATTINNRIMVPLRALSEALHLKVVWINATRSIFLTDNQTKIDLSIGSPLAHINGTSYTMDTSPIILHHRTMVPIRFIAEAFNMDVQWNTVASTVFINSLNTYQSQYDETGKVSYIGQLDASNKRCGFGTSYSKSGDIIYIGQWLSDEEYGLGTYTWKNGIFYQGECKNGEASGYGKMIFPYKGVYLGHFLHGKRDGLGHFSWYVGDKYIGYWKDDKRDGQGTYTFADGVILKGIWVRNKLPN